MKHQKYSVVAGIFLFVLAALISISLLLVAVDFGGISPAKNTIFYSLGKMFTGVYGFTSICIPLFLIIAGIQSFNARWRIRNGVMLLGSIIPFFTLDAVEHICRMIVGSDSDSVMIVKLSSTLLIGALILAAEYLLLSILGDVLENSISESEENTKFIFKDKDDKYTEESDYEEDSDESDETDDIIDDYEGILDDEEEEKLDLSNDEIFLHQKEILKDLIDDEKPAQEKTLEQEKTIVSEEPTIIEHEDFEGEEAIPELVSEENLTPEEELLEEADFAEPKLPEEPSPFDNIFDEQEKAHEEELAARQEQASEEILNDTEATLVEDFDEQPLPEEAPDVAEEIIAEDEEIQSEEDFEEEIPVSSEDFVNPDEFTDEFDEMNDVQPVAFDDSEEIADDADGVEEINDTAEIDEQPLPEEELDFAELPDTEIATEPEFESDEPVTEPELAQTPEDENPADYINIEDIAEEPEVISEGNFPEDLPENFPEESQTLPETTEKIAEEFEEPQEIEGNEEELEEPAESKILEESLEEPDFTTETAEAEPEPEATSFENEEETEIADEPFETEEDEDEETLGVEDIFSQMEADAAANPIIKDSDAVQANLNQNANETVEANSSSDTPMRRLSEYKIPTDLLEKFSNEEYWRIDDETKAAGENLKKTLMEFGIEATVTGIRKGPVVTMFELLPAPGVKLSKIVNLQDNIALSLAAKSVRIVAPIPGKHAVGIEIPNKERAIVSFREIIEQPLQDFKKMSIPVILGKDISGQSQIIDIAKTPHLLIAGATGAGKSVCVNSIILSILYNRSPNDVKLIMVDPKVVELKLYNDIPHLLTPVVTEPKRALQVLQYCICEMERRYALLDGMGVRDILSYNTRIRERRIATQKLPYIVVIIDEFADLMATSGKELETSVARLTAMSRAVGIHLVLATQRPSVNVITGLIKANIPSRIAFMVASRQDSQIIIDAIGAEKLLGKGDMLYTSAVNPIPTRIQGTLVGDNEVERVVDYVKTFGGPDYIDDEIFVDDDEDVDEEPGLFSDGEDPLYDQALQIVIQAGKASASYIQRRLKIGYNRAARLVEEMEERGIVGPANGSKPREVIHVP